MPWIKPGIREKHYPGMKVLKFGGTSVGTVSSLRNLKAIAGSLSEPAIIVVSALGGLTDQLIATADMAAGGNPEYHQRVQEFTARHFHIINEVVPEERREEVKKEVGALLSNLEDIYTGVSLLEDVSDRTLARIVGFGERMSSLIVAAMLGADHHDSLRFVKTERWFDKNIADRELTDRMIRDEFPLPLQRHAVCGGFISRDRDTAEVTNLGRGGSDYTAALIAAALDAESLEIWTDVNGFMTADPRIISDARVIDRMSFIESMELCSFGAKVIYPPTIYPVFHKNIPIRILNTHNPTAPGTLICDNSDTLPDDVRGVSAVKNCSMVSVEGVGTADVPDLNSRTFNSMARHGIRVFLVAQTQSDEVFSFVTDAKDAPKAKAALESEFAPELQQRKVSSIECVDKLAVIAVVRESIKQITGLGDKLVHAMSADGINVLATSDGASETTVAMVVGADDADRAVATAHAVCFGPNEE